MRERLGTAVMGVALALVVTACGAGADGGGTPPKGTVGVALPTRTAHKWVDDGANMRKQFRAAGYDVELRYADDSVSTQVDQIGAMVAHHDAALVVGAVDGSALGGVLHQAAGAGMPVIAYDRLVRGTADVDYYTAFDCTETGRLQGRSIADQLGLTDGSRTAPATIELFAGSPDDSNSRCFWKGALGVLQRYLDSGQLVVASGQTGFDQAATVRWDAATARARMADILRTSYTDRRLDAVLAPNDDLAQGTIAALQGAGYGAAAQPLPVVTGQDASLPAVRSIAAGEQSSTVYKDTRALAARAVAMTTAVLRGQEPEVNDDSTYDNGAEVVPSYLLQPVLVDATNWQQVLVDGGYYTLEQVAGL